MSRTETPLAEGIAAAKAGKKILARLQLENATELDPTNPNCWLWLAWTAESPVIAIASLEEVLSRNPEHRMAKLGLAWAQAMNDFELESEDDHIDEPLLSTLVNHEVDLDEQELQHQLAVSCFAMNVDTRVDDIDTNVQQFGPETSAEQTTTFDAGMLIDVPVFESQEQAEERELVEQLRERDELQMVADLSPGEINFDGDLDVTALLSQVESMSEDIEENVDVERIAEEMESLKSTEPSLSEVTPTDEQDSNSETEDVDPVAEELANELSEPTEIETVSQPTADPADNTTLTDAVSVESTAEDICEERVAEFELPSDDRVEAENEAEVESIVDEVVEMQESADQVIQRIDMHAPTATEAVEPKMEFIEEVETELETLVDAVDEQAAVETDEIEVEVAELEAEEELSTTSSESANTNEGNEANEDSRPLVLAIDDSPTVRKLLSRTLEKEGYRVQTAEDGMRALELIRTITPEVILMDINMPKLDGYRLCKLIKSHERTQETPVLMLTGKDGVFDKLRGKLVGCNGYLTKPFDADELINVVASFAPVSVTRA